MTEAIKVGISGTVDSGKTTVVKSVMKLLREDGFKIGGIIMDPIIENKKKIGYNIVDLYRDRAMKIAEESAGEKHIVEGYNTDVAAINDFGIPAITNHLYDVDIIIIDEIGKMSASSKVFMKKVMELLDEEIHIIITMDKRSRSTYLQDIRSRSDFRILDVTAINRPLLPHKIFGFFKEAVRFSNRYD